MHWVSKSLTIGLVCAWSVCPVPLAAQKHESFIGVVGGANLAKLSNGQLTGLDQKRTGFVVGGFARLGVSKTFAIEPEVLFSQQGAKGAIDAGVTGTLKIDYVKVPVLFNFLSPAGAKGKGSTRLFVGPQLGIKVSCKINGSSGSASVTADCKDVPLNVKSTDFGAVVGGAIDFGALSLGVRYDLGLTDTGESNGNESVKNRVWALTVGYGFRLK